MLYLPDSVYDELERISDEGRSGRMDPRAAGERLFAMCPEFLAAYALLDKACADAGDTEGARTWVWKAMEHVPLVSWAYFLAATFGDMFGELMAQRLREMAVWKLAVEDEIPPAVAGYFQGQADPQSELDFSDPETFFALGLLMEARREEEEVNDPPDVVQKLLPLRLVTDLQRQAEDAVDPAVLDQFRANTERCAPILLAAIRGWARFGYGTTPVVAMITAMLGEIGSPEHLSDLLELAQRSDPPIFLHAHWAIFRIGQRFPEAALEFFRAAIPQADANMRCAIAEQLSLMDVAPGLSATLHLLIEDFPKIAKQEDAAYLLLITLGELYDRENPDHVDQLERRCLPLLNRKGRKLIEDEAEDFIPALVADELDELTLEDVCLGRALMDEDEEDIEEDGEDDDEPLLVQPVRPGRNDPCWCGSGKKYKKCHLEADERGDRQRAQPAKKEPAGKAVLNPEIGELIPEVLNLVPKSAFIAAEEMYFEEDPEDVVRNAAAEGLFTQWLMFDFRLPATGRTPVEELLKRRARNLAPRLRAQLEAWQQTRLALLEVQRVDEGQGVEVKDLLAGGIYFVRDVSSSRSAAVWDCLLNRIEKIHGRNEFSGNGTTVPRDILPDLLAWIEDERKETNQSAADFVAANSHRMHRIVRELHEERFAALQVVNAEDQPIAYARAIYEVRDEHAAIDALLDTGAFAADDAARQKPARHFAWLSTEKADEGPRQTLGSIAIEEGKLRLETDSEERLERGRRLIEQHAGDWLTHVRNDVERYLRQHYSTWPDVPLPALSGRTPREAVRTREGRKAVENLLRSFENDEDRKRKAGEPAYDFSGLREELGL